MPNILREVEATRPANFVYPGESRPLTQGSPFAGEAGRQSDSQPPQLLGNWQRREEGEHTETEVDAQLHDFMEDVKRYIRGIDVGTL